VETTLTHTLATKLPKTPVKITFTALPTAVDVDEDYLENLY
jgi:hypothetical protein